MGSDCGRDLGSGTVSILSCTFRRVHQTLRVTPAMEAGIADHMWTLEEIVGLSP
jgi:hypothetical protein